MTWSNEMHASDGDRRRDSELVTYVDRVRRGGHVLVERLGEFTGLGWMLSAGILVTLVIVHPLLAADITGTWEVSYRVGQSQQVLIVELVQEGSGVSGIGTIQTANEENAVRVVVRSGAARAGDFRFLLTEDGGSESRSQEFVGDWYGDEMSGLTSGMLGTGMFAGTRRP
jgi:hypothetical protein